MYMNSHTILKDQLYAWTKSLTSYWAMQGNHCPCVRVTIRKQIRNMSGMVPAAYLLLSNRLEALIMSACEVERNTVAAKVNWQFRTADARVKLSSLYPRFTTASE